MPVRVIEHVDVDSFCRTMWPRLVGALNLSFGRLDLAEELAQEVLSRVVEQWDRVSTLEDPEAYTFRMGFNLGKSWWRRRAAEGRANDRHGSRPEGRDGELAPLLAVRQAVAQLSPRQREVVVYRYFLGCSVAETSAAMQCAEGTVKALTAQAIASLRAQGLGVDDG